MQFTTWLTVILGTIAVIITSIALSLRAHYHRIIKKKNEGIVHYIFELKELEKEKEHTDIEKKMMEKLLQEKYEILIMGRERE